MFASFPHAHQGLHFAHKSSRFGTLEDKTHAPTPVVRHTTNPFFQGRSMNLFISKMVETNWVNVLMY